MGDKEKNIIKKLSNSLYHENILTSFIVNLDTIIGSRFKKANNNVQEIGHSIINSVTELNKASNSINNFVKDGKKEIKDINAKNTKMIKEINHLGDSLTDIQNQVDNSINSITNMVDKFKEVNDLTDNIKRISKQTNILSINASIEASRAGEAGQGFAVVANEVKKLATETKETSNKISDKVGQLSKEINLVLDKINYLSDTFSVFTNITEKSMERTQDNLKLFKRLISEMDENNETLISNKENLNITVEDLKTLLRDIENIDEIVSIIINMQKNIKNINL
ncbi:MAG: methyl-accepting chemotaxis protein [Thermotogota bacterium]